jgi:hypothetical protein
VEFHLNDKNISGRNFIVLSSADNETAVCDNIIIIIIIIVVVVIFVITFMQGIYNYIPEINHVYSVYSVAAVL